MNSQGTDTQEFWLTVDAVETDLVGYWPLDETGGLTAYDASGNGRDGTLVNMAGTEWTPGMLRGALDLTAPADGAPGQP